MATILNDRDVLLQAASPRNNAPALGKAFILTTDTQVFKVVSGVSTPTVANLKTQRVGIPSNVSWSVSGATGLTIAGDTFSATLAYSAMTAATATVTAQTTYLGVTYIQSQIINRVSDGTNGSNGSSGSNGQRGTVTLVGSASSWSDSSANAVISSNGSGSPINGDIVTLTNSSSFSQTRYYNFGSWLILTAYINGNLLVTGTVSANQISGGTLKGVMVRFGSGNTPAGYAFEITSVGTVWADNLFGGVATFNNNFISANSLQASSFRNTEAFIGTGTTSGAGCHGIRGRNSSNGTSGLVGAANGYDFYADGSGTNYGPFTGAHDVLVENGTAAELGDLVVDVRCVARQGWSNTLFAVELSSTPMQAGVLGMLASYQGALNERQPAAMALSYSGVDPAGRGTYNTQMSEEWHLAKDDYQLWAANAVGEGQMSVCGEGGDIQKGDLLVTSSLPGKGMRQPDGLVRNYTVARARESVAFSSPSEIKQIACIYLCG